MEQHLPAEICVLSKCRQCTVVKCTHGSMDIGTDGSILIHPPVTEVPSPHTASQGAPQAAPLLTRVMG